MNLVQKLSRITLICSEPERLAVFYESAFGFARTGDVSITEPAFAKLLGIAGAAARSVTLQLGEQEIELLGVRPLGRPYPRRVLGGALSFSISPSWSPIWEAHTHDYQRVGVGRRRARLWIAMAHYPPRRRLVRLVPDSTGDAGVGHSLWIARFPARRTAGGAAKGLLLQPDASRADRSAVLSLAPATGRSCLQMLQGGVGARTTAPAGLAAPARPGGSGGVCLTSICCEPAAQGSGAALAGPRNSSPWPRELAAASGGVWFSSRPNAAFLRQQMTSSTHLVMTAG